ncbi:MAG: tetratricopeptide repeat protein [Candidatus Obscuribacterales bacterium]|nr:tetratricopeptide repeat protein [Candidatus Obscuribacterales bacterium]
MSNQLPSFPNQQNTTMWLDDSELKSLRDRSWLSRLSSSGGGLFVLAFFMTAMILRNAEILAVFGCFYLLLVIALIRGISNGPNDPIYAKLRTLGLATLMKSCGFNDECAIIEANEHTAKGRFVQAQISCAQMRSNRFPLTNTYIAGGRLEKVESHLRAELEKHKTVATTSSLGSVLFLKGEWSAAAELSEQVVKGVSADVDDPIRQYYRTASHLILARARVRLNMLEEGERILENIELVHTRANGNGEGFRRDLTIAFAELRVQQGRFEEALLHAQSAFELFRSRYGASNAYSVYARRVLAYVLLRAGRTDESAAHALGAEMDEQIMVEDNESAAEQLRQTRLLTTS